MTIQNVSCAEPLENYLVFLELQAVRRHFVLDTLNSTRLALAYIGIPPSFE